MIYEREGDVDSANKYKRIVERHRKKNPYYLYYLSSLAFDEGRYRESQEMLRKAIDLQDSEYRFHYGLARTLAQVGDMAAAQVSLERAVQLAPESAWTDGVIQTAPSLDNLPALPE
jgi:predicted Zn-dependent protease